MNAAKILKAEADKRNYAAAIKDHGMDSPQAIAAVTQMLKTATLGRGGKKR